MVDAMWEQLRQIDLDLYAALEGARLSDTRRRAIVDYAIRRQAERRHERLVTDNLRGMVRGADQKAADLAVHLRDRDAHIRNLEAQLMPHLRADPAHTQPSLM